MLWLWILIAVVVIAVIGGVVSYNRFISQKNLIKDAWANIDTELKRRYDLIPNLVETVKGYAAHEQEVFEEVARARAMAAGATGSPAAQAAAEGPLVAALGKLFAVAENYPDLKANQNFLALQARAHQHRGSASRRRGASTTRTSASTTGASNPSRRTWSRTCSTSSGGVLRGGGGDREATRASRRWASTAGGSGRPSAARRSRRRRRRLRLRRLTTCRNPRANPRRRTRPASGRPGTAIGLGRFVGVLVGLSALERRPSRTRG